MNRLPPFFELLTYFILGILMGCSTSLNNLILLSTAILGIVSAYVVHRFSLKRRISLSNISFRLGLLVCIASIGCIRTNQTKIETGIAWKNESTVRLIGTVKQLEGTRSKGKFVLSDVSLLTDTVVQILDAEFLVRFNKHTREEIFPDDQVLVHGTIRSIRPNKNPGSFDYWTYVKRKGITAQVEARKLVQLTTNPYSINGFFFSVRTGLSARLKKQLAKREFSVANALILGEKKDLTSDLKAAYAKAGAMHILAVSGLHVGLIFLIFNSLFSPVMKLRRGKVLRALLLIIVIVFYAGLTGFSPSVTRATLMFSLLALAKCTGRRALIYNVLYASAFLMLFAQPNDIFDVGFQLSYTAVIGIVYLYPRLLKQYEPTAYLGRKLWSLFCLALAAQIATFPIAMFYFHQFPSLFFITNLVVVPGASLVLIGGIVLLVMSSFSWGAIYSVVYEYCVSGLNHFVFYISELPYASISRIYIEWYHVVMIYLIISVLVLQLEYQWKKMVYLLYLSILVLALDHTWNKFIRLSTSGLVVFQTQVPSVLVFKGKEGVVYLPYEQRKNGWANKNIDQFCAYSGRNQVDKKWLNVVEIKTIKWRKFADRTVVELLETPYRNEYKERGVELLPFQQGRNYFFLETKKAGNTRFSIQ